MANLEVPPLLFTEWHRWIARSRPSQNLDVPPEFGILGLYLLARSDAEAFPAELGTDERHLHSQVVYIGMSTHVEQRLERTHAGVRRYREHFEDSRCKNLWFSVWHSDISNWHLEKPAGVVARATIALYERALLLAYAKKHGRLPLLNKR